MGKIGDLFVKLGLKNEQFKQGIEESKREANGFAETMNAVRLKCVAIWGMIGTAVGKLAFDFIKSSNQIGDAWDKTMAKCKSAWHTFTQSLTSWNWKDFGERMKSGMEAASQLTGTKDAEFEVMNSINIRRAEMSEQLEILREEANNQNLSYKQRAEAGKKYLKMVEGLYDDETKYRKKLMDDTIEYWYSQSDELDFNDDNAEIMAGYLRTFLKRLEVDEDMMEALSNASSDARENYDKYLKWVWDSTDESEKEFRRVAKALYDHYNTIGGRDTTNGDLVSAIAGYEVSKSAFRSENRRITTALNSNLAQIGNDETTAPKVERSGERISALGGLGTMGVQSEYAGGGMGKLAGETQRYAEQAAKAAENSEWLQGQLQKIAEVSYALGDAIAAGISDALQEFTDQLFGLAEANPQAIFANLLQPLADMAKRMGEIMIAEGVAIKAQEFAQKAGFMAGGVPLIAAGAALVAIGAAATSALSALAASGGSGTATTSMSTSTAGATTSSAELTVYVKGTIKGSDILISGQNTQSEWNK